MPHMLSSETPTALAEWAQRRSLPLSVRDAAILLEAHADALTSTGRIEIEDGLLHSLIEAFADSPYLDSPSVLCELTALFYHLKNSCDDHIPDDLLLRRMAECFDECRGSIELLTDYMEGGLS